MINIFNDLKKNINNYLAKEPEISISFQFGVRVDIRGYSRKKYRVEFWDEDTMEFYSELKSGYFASPNRKYVVKWTVKVFDGDKLIRNESVNFKGKIVYVAIESSSLGDNLAYVSQIVKFAEVNKCKLILTTFFNSLFENQYPDVTFIVPGGSLLYHDYAYRIGYFYDEENRFKTPVDPRTVPLGKVPCDILQIPYEEIRPKLNFTIGKRPQKKKYVCIATQSTASAKYWHRENGWQDVVNYLNEKGYDVAVIHKEPTELKNVIDWTGDRPLDERMNQLHHAEFFIGLGSGLSWLAWGMKKKVILISGFSDAFSEFQLDCERVINKDVCNSCWNDTTFSFDKGDWNWCPRNKNTEKQFECSKQISPEMIYEKIEKVISVSI